MSNQFTSGWKEEEIAKLKVLVDEGYSNQEISKKLGRTAKSISVKKHRLGLINKYDHEKYKNKDWLHRKYVIEGLSTIDLAEITGVHYATIARWLNGFGIEVRGFHEMTDRQRKKIGEAGKLRTFEKHGRWKGGKTKTNEGYVYVKVKEHPNSNANNAVLEHRLVMEKFLGRYLESHEVVHHINEIKDDNRIGNLFVFYSGKDHTHFHAKQSKNPNFPLLYKYNYLYQEEKTI